MGSPEEPLYRTGKICYLEIPATDVRTSADFYHRAFGWPLRDDGGGAIAFDGTVGGVSGMWVLDRPPSSEPGLVVSIMVASATECVKAIVGAGGTIVKPIDPAAGEITAWFRDPAGNVLGIYQQQGLANAEGRL
jgi:hypothetical protein